MPALLMERPAVVKPLQRRAHFRVRMLPEDNFTIQLWRIAEHVDPRDPPLDICEPLGHAVQFERGRSGGELISPRPLLVGDQRMTNPAQPRGCRTDAAGGSKPLGAIQPME